MGVAADMRVVVEAMVGAAAGAATEAVGEVTVEGGVAVTESA